MRTRPVPGRRTPVSRAGSVTSGPTVGRRSPCPGRRSIARVLPRFQGVDQSCASRSTRWQGAGEIIMPALVFGLLVTRSAAVDSTPSTRSGRVRFMGSDVRADEQFVSGDLRTSRASDRAGHPVFQHGMSDSFLSGPGLGLGRAVHLLLRLFGRPQRGCRDVARGELRHGAADPDDPPVLRRLSVGSGRSS